ncbi:MAG: translation elongation factor EF-1 subunit alpha [Candidatus Helarchaeota archaeon]|nr:translation elongation factor EF-1 subunit alpha [Candidatus Helarchaeota archaeon]
MSKEDKKPHLNLIIIGHVDHGKSTMMGHLLLKTNSITEREMREMEALAKKLDKGSFKFAFVFDRLKEERERGLTIDLAFRKFLTKKYYFTLIDAPGHRDFVKNMITGSSQADAAILVVSAKTGEFEAGISAGGQTREHAFLSRTLGVSQLIVAINKMDDASVKWGEERYNEVRDEVKDLLKIVGFPVDKVNFVPVSAWTGDNLAEKSDKMGWYKGPCLTDALDEIELPPKPTDKPLRLPVQDVYKITGVGTVPVGRIETGVLKVGDNLVFMPGGTAGECRSIEMHHEQIKEALPGDNIGFNIRGVSVKDVKRGEVAGKANKPPTVAEEFIGQVIVIYHPTALAVGYAPVIHAHTAQVACKFEELISKIDPKSGQVIQEKPDFLKQGEGGMVRFKPLRPMVIETYKDFPQLGRFAVRDMGRTVAVGVVTKVIKKKLEK